MSCTDMVSFVWVHEKPGIRFMLMNLAAIVAMAEDGTGGTFIWFAPNNAGNFSTVNRFNVQESIVQIAEMSGFPTIGI